MKKVVNILYINSQKESLYTARGATFTLLQVFFFIQGNLQVNL